MEFIKDISNSFGTLSPFLTFIVIITIVVLYFLKDTINDGLKNLMLKKKKSQIVNLKKHDFFIVLESVRSKIHEIIFITHGEEDPSKTYLLQLLIDIKIDKARELFFLFLENKHLKNYSGQELKFEIDSLLRKLVKDYSLDALESFRNLGVEKEDALFFIESYETFRRDIMNGYIERIESISTNEDYNSNYDRISAVLEVIALGFYVIPKDAKNACNLINGKFKKYKDLKK